MKMGWSDFHNYINFVKLKKVKMEKSGDFLKNKIVSYITNPKCIMQELKSGDLRALIEGLAVIITVAYIFYGNVMASILLSPYVIYYIRNKRTERLEQSKKTLTVKFKDGLMSVAFALNAGYSVENGFREAVKELCSLYGENDKITKEFANIVYRINRNESLEDILDEFAKETDIEDIRYFAEIFRYAKKSGGDLIAVIRNTADNIREKTETMQEINTLISGKKMEQKIMGLVPFGMIMYLKLASSEFIEPLYGNATGIFIMTVCLIMYVFSNCLAKRIVNIEV